MNIQFRLPRILAAAFLVGACGLAWAQGALRGEQVGDYLLGSGDVVHITVFQNPDLTTDARVSETGSITFPLVGAVQVGGLTQQGAEKKLGNLLKEGGFVVQPQVNLLVTQVRGNQVSVLGQVNRPGRYPLETTNTRLTDMLAIAGGISVTGADSVVVSGLRDGRAFRKEVDIASMYLQGDFSGDVGLLGGDSIYVHRAPVFYIYGEVQRPGAFRLERGMTVTQALATGGGITLRGTLKGMLVNRRDARGNILSIEPKMDTELKADDVIYVRESLF